MARIELTAPPNLRKQAKHPEYKAWLAENFYLDICSYCLQQYRDSLSIDHYIPRQFDPSRIDDPGNLLLSCQSCGRQKLDYHPEHVTRRRLPRDTTGFMALDVRADDLAELVVIEDDGALSPRPTLGGSEYERAAWNVALLRLDLKDAQRARLLEKLRLVEGLRQVDEAERTKRERESLDILEHDLAEHLPAIRAFGLPLSSDLRASLEQLARELIAASGSRVRR